MRVEEEGRRSEPFLLISKETPLQLENFLSCTLAALFIFELDQDWDVDLESSLLPELFISLGSSATQTSNDVLNLLEVVTLLESLGAGAGRSSFCS